MIFNKTIYLSVSLTLFFTPHLCAIEKPDIIDSAVWKKAYWYKSSPPTFKKASPKAQYRKIGQINHLTFHYAHRDSAGSSRKEEIAAIGDGLWMWHARENSYQDIGYHYIIGQSGNIYKGRPDTIAPASGTYYFSPKDLNNSKYLANGKLDKSNLKAGKAPGHNQGHLTICFLVKKQKPTKEAYDSATKLTAYLLKLHMLDTNAIRVHCEMAASSCPGIHVHQWIRGQVSSKGHRQTGVGIANISKRLQE